jgi:hypothetical protein
MEKRKNNLTVLIFTFFSLIIMLGCNKYSDEIEKTCSNCEQIKVRKSDDIIVVKRPDGKGNVFSKSKMKFLVDNWYEVIYDEGIFFDDIRFNIDGKYISFTEDRYSEISNENIKKSTGYDAVKEHIDKVFNNYKECIEKAKSNPNTEGRYIEYNKCYIWYADALSIGRIKEECANEKVSDSQTQELIDYSEKKINELPARN